MPVSWGIKDPNEVRSYSYSWLGRLNGAEIVSATLVVQCGTIALSNVANTIDGVSATISGGAECERATVVSTIVTSDGQTLEESFLLVIEPSAYASIGPSTSTKRQIIEMAYEECALSGYEFDVTPEELFSGLRSLDALMAQWRISSKDLGYNAPAIFGQGDLEDYSGIPDGTVAGVALSLAMSMAPKMRKAMSAETRGRLNASMSAISTLCARIPRQGWGRSTPAGSGNRYRQWSPFMPTGRRPC